MNARYLSVVTWRTYGTRGFLQSTGFYPREAPMGLNAEVMQNREAPFNSAGAANDVRKTKGNHSEREFSN